MQARDGLVCEAKLSRHSSLNQILLTWNTMHIIYIIYASEYKHYPNMRLILTLLPSFVEMIAELQNLAITSYNNCQKYIAAS